MDRDGHADGLEAAGRAAFAQGRAATLVVESVFDEVFTAEAWRVLAAAVDRIGGAGR